MKVYPNKLRVYDFHHPFLKKKNDVEEPEPIYKSEQILQRFLGNKDDESLLRSIFRTKTTISDIVLCNEFDLFATFTFKSDRQDIDKCKRKMQDWLKSQQKFHGKFSYIIVPEFHKDKKSLHFHALMKNYTGKLTDSGKKINNRKAYNFAGYEKGWSSAVYIDNVEKVSSYVKKYITKEMVNTFGKKRYWCSKGLKRPELIYNTDFLENVVYPFNEDWQNQFFTIYEYNGTIKPLIK